MKDFALIGGAGFIAPRHLKAIKETNNSLVAALDKFDSVGVMDSYFPSASFFVEFERFDRHLEMLNSSGHPIDYLSICSPNYLHDSHIRFGLRHRATVICEKPLVLNPWNVEALEQIQAETGKEVFNILQLRLHPDIIALKEKVHQKKIEAEDKNKRILHLSQEIQVLQEQVLALQQEINENEDKIEASTGGYKIASEQMKQRIQADIQKIKQFIQ